MKDKSVHSFDTTNTPVFRILSIVSFLQFPQNVKSYSVDYSCLHSRSWLVNSHSERNPHFSSQSDIIESNYDIQGHWDINHTGIVKYDHYLRPNEYTKYQHNQSLISFGDDLSLKGCRGYWPNNDECPLVQEYHTQYSLEPSIEVSPGGGCFQNSRTIGQFVNGANVYSFLHPRDNSDHKKIPSIWNELRTSPRSEKETISDLCNGFVENGRYGHATYSSCLSERLQEDGQDHSKIYGWSLDNYPIHGPYQARGVLAKSSWRPRDYSSANSPSGCKSTSLSSSFSVRSCLLKDPLHPEDGVVELEPNQFGPSFEEMPLGSFYEDYFYDSHFYHKSLDQEYLDEHNGHEHEPYGYHYHMTVTAPGTLDNEAIEELQPVFPFILGPRFYGCLASNPNVFCCQSIEESVQKNCPLTASSSSVPSQLTSCGSSQATRRHRCLGPSPLPDPGIQTSARQLDEGTTSAPTLFTPSDSLTPTATPTAFQSPTFKPTISFISHSPTSLTAFPSLSPSTTKQAAHGGTSHVLTSQDIALIVLISVGGLVAIGSLGVLIYWHYYSRTGPSQSSYSHPSSNNPSSASASTSASYAEKIKDLTGISLVEKI